ncbi:MAG: transketolase family protein [Bacillota bacterium]|jgi:transketolase|nr:MAG: transketolase family protein [Bacillota bacterium]
MTNPTEPKKVATREAYGEALVEAGGARPDIVVLDADLSASTRTQLFAEKYPDRFFNMGIAEANMIGVAAGLAAAGKIPFASTFAVFAPGRVYDQIRLSVAYPRLGVKIASTHAGLTVGEDGASHQSLEDLALARVLPNMTVIVPADGAETRAAVFAAIEHEGPVYLRLGRVPVPAIYPPDKRFTVGRYDMLKEGRDVALVACGLMVEVCLQAAVTLAAEDILAGVVNASTVKPLDEETLTYVASRAGAVVTAEEHSVLGGLGGAVTEFLSGIHPVPVVRVGVDDRFGQSGRPGELLEAYGLTASRVADAARKAVALKKGR